MVMERIDETGRRVYLGLCLVLACVLEGVRVEASRYMPLT